MSASFYDLLKYAKTGIAAPDMTAYDKMRAVAMAGGKVKTLTGVPPLSFKSNGKPLISWSMIGNGQQNGTPAPDALIMPQLVGEKTENIVPSIRSANGWRQGYMTGGVYNPTNTNGEWLSPFIDVDDMTSFTISAKTVAESPSMSVYWFNGDSYITASSGTVYSGQAFDVRENATKFCFAIRTFDKTESEIISDDFWVMLNTGSTAKPYEPYGYSIPITNAGQTVPIYLGQTQTVRRVKKLVLDGTEDGWNATSTSGRYVLTIDDVGYGHVGLITTICSHYPSVANQNLQGMPRPAICANINYPYLNFSFEHGVQLESFKQFLNQQYSAGTPVTVWYVLATPTTGIVNEPLAKIGDYADELHSTDAGVSIPTARGQNTLTVDTDLQPSSMTITYR